MYRQTTDVDHGARSKSPEPQAAAVPWKGHWQHPLAAGHTAPGQDRWGFLHGISVAVVQLQATSAPHQNNLTREGGMQPKIVNI